MYDGMVRKDGRLLSEVFDDSFVLIHMTGMKSRERSKSFMTRARFYISGFPRPGRTPFAVPMQYSP